ncbi:MAG: hypothetical protein K6G32_01225 [Prevotella sp.]|nr:hypothetical protein [Prevotella sp.]
MEEEKKKSDITNHFEAGANCQVFNGPISGCVFAMPGANITQNPVQPSAQLNDQQQDVVEKLKPMFYGQVEDAKTFLVSIQGMKPTQITDKVNQLVREKKISDMSKHRDLWKVLHDCSIYDKSESNWNMQVK